MLKAQIAECCRKLRLSRTLADNSETVGAESPQEYLLQLLKREILHRESGKRERLVKAAGFYSRKTFDDYRFDEVRLPSGVTPDYLKRGTFIGETKNLILYGNVGTGKTHLATAIGIEACGRGLSVGFHRTASLVGVCQPTCRVTGVKVSRALSSFSGLSHTTVSSSRFLTGRVFHRSGVFRLASSNTCFLASRIAADSPRCRCPGVTYFKAL